MVTNENSSVNSIRKNYDQMHIRWREEHKEKKSYLKRRVCIYNAFRTTFSVFFHHEIEEE